MKKDFCSIVDERIDELKEKIEKLERVPIESARVKEFLEITRETLKLNISLKKHLCGKLLH